MAFYRTPSYEKQPMKTPHNFDLLTTTEMQALFTLLEQRFNAEVEESAKSQPEFERELRDHMLALERCIHTNDFRRLDVDVPGIVVEGARYRRLNKKSEGKYMTLAGPIQVERTTYRGRGGHGGNTIAPLELHLGLLNNHWTSAAAETASAFITSVPSKEAANLLSKAGSMAPSPSHLDRLSKHVSERWEANRTHFETEVRGAEHFDLPDPKDVAHIMFSLDGIMLPMKETSKSPELEQKSPSSNDKKEVGCATVSLYNKEGERLHTVRFARMPESRKITLHQQLFDEVAAMHARYPTASLQAVADGARENWRIIQDITERLDCEVEETLDYFHACEHLVKGLRAAGMSDDDIKVWKLRLRDEPDGERLVVEELTFWTMASQKQAVESEFNYFLNQGGRIEYAALKKRHSPIGSGVQEAACKTLVTERMKRSGMSWCKPGGQAILTLRGLTQSGRFSHAWKALRSALRQPFQVDLNLERQKRHYAVAA